jgi:hypothetical protein
MTSGFSRNGRGVGRTIKGGVPLGRNDTVPIGVGGIGVGSEAQPASMASRVIITQAAITLVHLLVTHSTFSRFSNSLTLSESI